MKTSMKQFEAMQLRALNTQKAIESVVVSLVSLFVISFAPQLLVEYFYGQEMLMAGEQPALLKYIPIAGFAIVVLYGLNVLIGNFVRGRRIKTLVDDMKLAEELETMPGTSDDEELKELEQMVDEALAKKSVPAKKKARAKRK